MKIPLSKPLADPDEDAARNAIVLALESDPEHYLAKYSRQFGNVLNADSAATLFAHYNADPAKYRVAVHPAAQWLRDELFRPALQRRDKNRIVFTSGGNAAGAYTEIRYALDRILDSEYRAGHISQAVYQRISGRSEPPIC